MVTTAEVAAARVARKRRRAAGLGCPLCTAARCRCSAVALAKWTARQGVLPGVDLVNDSAPSMPATPHGQGRLF
ncbi:MAG TPA: hypothetical protein VKQ32_09615 [Polyangia bacterium]|nr:hypothetical protein [Polyangia bacterium]